MNTRQQNQYEGAPNEKILAKHLNNIFCFATLFQSFLKTYLCKLMHIDPFGVFRWKCRLQKISGNGILSAEFPTWKGLELPKFPAENGSISENASWPKGHFCSPKINLFLCYGILRWCFAKGISSFYFNLNRISPVIKAWYSAEANRWVPW